mmetsp:Transcript_38034/g.95596  ORF Transcript_38034/g.95596 Transcript_38034/m.95596 type:complete len:271 (-) Transcript_38034:788-1600(-)
MGRLAEPKGFDVTAVSHQEMARIIDTLDDVYGSVQQAGAEWLPVQGAGSLVSEELGYEDVDEFEDALHGSWGDFLDALPHVVKKADPSVTGGVVFRLKADPPLEEWKPTKMTIHVKDSHQLFNQALLKSPYASLKIPHIEFEVQADGKRMFNTLYNHLAGALFNLGQHAEMLGEGPTADAVLEACEQISTLLDVPEPYTIVVEDKSGISDLKPMDDTVVEDMTDEEIASARITEPILPTPAMVMQMPGTEGAEHAAAPGGGLDDIDEEAD